MPGSLIALRRLAYAVLGAALWLGWSTIAAAGVAGRSTTPAAIAPAMTRPSPGPGAQPRLRKGIFLVASPKLNDPNFAKTVVLLVGYGTRGAVGIIINRPTGMPASHLLPDYRRLSALDAKVLVGGPVGLNTVRLLVHNGPHMRGSLEVFPGTYLIDSQASLRKLLATSTKNVQLRFYAGYAGWGPGQLDAEVHRGDWYTWRADVKTVFDKPAASIWPDLMLDAGGQWVHNAAPRREPITLCRTRASIDLSRDANMISNGFWGGSGCARRVPGVRKRDLLHTGQRNALCETVHVSSVDGYCPMGLLL